MRLAVVAVLLAACSARLGGPGGGGGGDVDASHGAVDGHTAVPIDAPPDARLCAGGDAAAMAAGGSCLLFHTAPKTFDNAEAACELDGTHLAIINTAADEASAETLIGALDTFIGGTDRVAEGTFKWVDNTNVTYTDWRSGEPNNGNGSYEEDCIVIAGSKPGKGWDDKPCLPPPANAGSYAYLCQF